MWLLLVACGQAWATTGHDFAGQFGEYGSGDGQFKGPAQNGPVGLAVLPSTGEVFTADSPSDGSTARVQRFSGAGTFQSAFPTDPSYSLQGPIAIDSAGSALYQLAWGDFGNLVKYNLSGGPADVLDSSTSGTSINFFGSAALTVDPADGTVYAVATVNDPNSPLYGAQVIDSFDPTGSFITSFDGSSLSPDGGFVCPTGLAVDNSHRVYVLDVCKNGSLGRVDQYTAAGSFLATVDDGSRGAPSAVAVDPSSGEVYVAEAGPVGVQITQFGTGGGAAVYTFDAGNVAGVRAMAVSSDGTVYTSDATNPVVERFIKFDGPTVTTDPPTSIEPRSATLNGTVNPEGVASRYHFEYGKSLAYGSRTPAVDTDVGSGSAAVPASAVAGGLEPNMTYHYRIVGLNGAGSITGSDQTVTTAPAAASTDGPVGVSAITPIGAHLHATVNANNHGQGFPPFTNFATYHFEYGVTTAYGQTAVGADGGTFCGTGTPVVCDGADRPVVAALSGLAPNTTYHFRVVADNGTADGPQQGVDHVFTTAPAAGAGATDLTANTATLTGTLNAHGSATTYHFDYGPSANYGAHTPEVDGGSVDGDRAVSQQVVGLSPSTTYHVQLVATTDGVVRTVRTGGDGVFRTPSAPTATAALPVGVSTNAATLVGTVNTHEATGSYHFSVASLDSSFTLSTGERSLSAIDGVQQVAAVVKGLPAGESFRVQLIVSSGGASEYSNQITFATAPQPTVLPALPETDPTTVFGCTAPHIDTYNSRPRPGDSIRISGRDLGVGGGVALGERSLTPTAWSVNGFTIELPDDVSGTLGLTINCGHLSNTIAIALFQQPDNTFAITRRSMSGATASLAVRLPGPGKVRTSGRGTRATTTTITKAGVRTISVRLTPAASTALRKAHAGSLVTNVGVRFTPAGGRTKTKTITLTYTHRTSR